MTEKSDKKRWIKLYASIARSDHFKDDAELGFAVRLLLMAAWKETKITIRWTGEEITLQPGQIAHSIRYLAEGAGVPRSTMERRLTKWEQAGFLKIERFKTYCLITIAKWSLYQHADSETETESPMPETTNVARDMAAIWNEVCGAKLGDVRRASPNRKKMMLKRFREDFHGDIEEWRAYCRLIVTNEFLNGDEKKGTDRPWKCDFDWVIKPDNCNKILEGKYVRSQQGQQDANVTDFDRAMAQWLRGDRTGPRPSRDDFDKNGRRKQ